MFIDRLTKDDVQDLISRLGLERYEIMSVDHINVLNINRWDIRLKSKSTGIKSIIFFSDFDIFGEVVNYSTKDVFKTFMHERFGDEYKQAFNERLRKKYEEEMIK